MTIDVFKKYLIRAQLELKKISILHDLEIKKLIKKYTVKENGLTFISAPDEEVSKKISQWNIKKDEKRGKKMFKNDICKCSYEKRTFEIFVTHIFSGHDVVHCICGHCNKTIFYTTIDYILDQKHCDCCYCCYGHDECIDKVCK